MHAECLLALATSTGRRLPAGDLVGNLGQRQVPTVVLRDRHRRVLRQLNQEPARLSLAIAGFRGRYSSARAFIAADVSVEVPPAVWSWLEQCVDFDAAARHYRAMGSIFVAWDGQTYVFEVV